MSNHRTIDATGGGLYDRVVNAMAPRSKNKLKDGEVHPLLYTKDGFQIPSYIGPGTDLYPKLRNNVKPISAVDKVAMAHDIRYTLARNKDEIREADLKMVSKLDSIQKNREDYLYNIYEGKLPIKAKMKMEDWGLVGQDTFTNTTSLPNPEDKELLESHLSALQADGYGKRSMHISHLSNTYRESLMNSGITYN